MRKIAIIFHRIGPYHWARLQAAARTCRLLAFELSAETAEYAWDKVSGPADFRRVTLFETGDSRTAPVGELKSRLARVLEEFRPEVVAIPGWSDCGALLALGWCVSRGVPIVLMCESTAWDERRVGWKEWIKSRIVRLYGAGLVGGGPHADYLSALGMPRSRILLGYDVVDNEFFALGAQEARKRGVEMRSRYRLPTSYFLANARFLPKKNITGLLRAYARYRALSHGPVATQGNCNAPWDLVLLGDGPFRPMVQSEVQGLGLDGHTYLPGFKQYGDLPAYYGLASAFVHASTSEPWGLVVNEALASGLPVLVSNRCGCAVDLVKEGVNGFLFGPRDTETLARLMQKVSTIPAEQRRGMGQASQRSVAGWGPDRFARGLQEAAEAALNADRISMGSLDHALLRCAISQSNYGRGRSLKSLKG